MTHVDFLLEKARQNISASRLLIREGHHDIAVSRSYYAMFYLAELLLFTKGLTYTSHSAVVAAFGKEFAKTGLMPSEFHRYLIEAFEARQLGDYGIHITVTKEQSEQVIIWANSFLEEVEIYLSQT
jgi:uncharacterized protein (UPF0332 family)